MADNQAARATVDAAMADNQTASVPGKQAARMPVVEDADTPVQVADYVFKDGLRFVRPYFFDFKLHVKKRMEGKTIIQLFSDEFPARNQDYYVSAFKDGRLRVEGRTDITMDTPLKSGTCLRHFIHRHEPAVLAAAVQVVGTTPSLVAVHKPACLPVHTVGQYRKNTLLHILQAEHPSLWPLYPTHRLDNPVSGLLVFARSVEAANQLRQKLESRSMEKVYVARVIGVFPEEELSVDAPLIWDAKTNHVSVPDSADAGRPSLTVFKRLSVAADKATSVVECRPKTGRTHQIRVHLQHAGHPIANDTQYGGQYGLPLPNFRNRKRQDSSMPEPDPKRHRTPVGIPAAVDCAAAAGRPAGDEVNEQSQTTINETVGIPKGEAAAHGKDRQESELHASRAAGGGESAVEDASGGGPLYKVDPANFDPLCMTCPALPPPDYPLHLEPLWLHARSYSCDEWQFEAPLPAWAEQGFIPVVQQS